MGVASEPVLGTADASTGLGDCCAASWLLSFENRLGLAYMQAEILVQTLRCWCSKEKRNMSGLSWDSTDTHQTEA